MHIKCNTALPAHECVDSFCGGSESSFQLSLFGPRKVQEGVEAGMQRLGELHQIRIGLRFGRLGPIELVLHFLQLL